MCSHARKGISRVARRDLRARTLLAYPVHGVTPATGLDPLEQREIWRTVAQFWMLKRFVASDVRLW